MEDILTLAEMADELGLRSADGLRTQVHRGRLVARLIGKTWVVSRAEVERYRRESLGRPGRPREDAPKTDMSAKGDDGQIYGG